MNKKDLVKSIAKKCQISLEEAKRGLETTLHIIKENLSKGKKVTLIGFGVFSTYKRKAKTGKNPNSGKALKIAAKNVVKFKASNLFEKKAKAETRNIIPPSPPDPPIPGPKKPKGK